MTQAAYDVLIVGAGPAGLHAAFKTALLFHTALVVDKGQKFGPIFYTPEVWNLPGIEGGIRGNDLLKRQRRQIEAYETAKSRKFVSFLIGHEAIRVQRQESGDDEVAYTLEVRDVKTGAIQAVTGKNLVLATGVVDRQPVFEKARGRDIDLILPYANKGLSEYCLLCDGHALSGKQVAVVGCGPEPAIVASVLKRHFQAVATVVTCRGMHPKGQQLTADEMKEMETYTAERGVGLVDKDVVDLFGLRENKIGFVYADGTRQLFDKAMIDMGWHQVRNELAVQLGAALDPGGGVRTSRDCEVLDGDGKVIHGLFAVGDIRSGTWNQVPVGWGEAETAIIHAFAEHL